MSNFSPYQDPGYLPYGTPAPNPRPGVITGIAIAGIVLASMGLACNVFGLFGSTMLLVNGGKNPMAPQLGQMQSSSVTLFNVVAAVVGMVIWIWLMVGSIASLRLGGWALIAMRSWAVVMIIWQIIVLIMQITLVIPESVRRMSQFATLGNARAGMPANPFASMMGPVAYAMAVGVVILMCVLPVLILILWRTPKVKAAFSGAPGLMPPPQPYPPNHFQQYPQ